MDEQDDLSWLMQWYIGQCDADWEHEFGVKIDTLDNPGWSLVVDLHATQLEGRHYTPLFDGVQEEEPIQGKNGDVPWLVCKVEGSKSKAYGGPRDLKRMIQTFRTWAENSI